MALFSERYGEKKSGVLMHSDDGGLKEPVRKFEDTFSAVTVLTEMFFSPKKAEEK